SYHMGIKLSKFENLKSNKKNIDQMIGDMFFYNTLLYFYIVPDKINEKKLETLKNIFILYNVDRNGSAHTGQKNKDSAKIVREKVIGNKVTGKHNNSIIFKLLHEVEL
ncbi:hypothetical protein ACFL20_12965, partial [Spirochaetota bacterium]